MISVVLLALLQPQAIVVDPDVISPGEMVTIASSRYECDLRKDDGTDLRFSLRLASGQAERDHMTGALMGTTLTVEVVTDPKNALSGYALHAWGTDSIFGDAQENLSGNALSFGRKFQMIVDETEREWVLNQSSRVAIRIQEYRAPQWGMRAFVRAVGFCNVTPTQPTKPGGPVAKESSQ